MKKFSLKWIPVSSPVSKALKISASFQHHEHQLCHKLYGNSSYGSVTKYVSCDQNKEIDKGKKALSPYIYRSQSMTLIITTFSTSSR